MERIVKRGVVVLLFPFSDFSSAKRRPAVVVANVVGDDIIPAQITSVNCRDRYAISLEAKDFKFGKLPVSSLIQSNKLFTADTSIISSKVGSLKENKIKEVQNSLINIFRN
jgi:mRNA interferase MazF